MSFQFVAVAPVVAPTPANGTAAVQPNLGGTRPAVVPMMPLPSGRRSNNQSLGTLYRRRGFPPSIDDMEAAQFLQGVHDPFFSILKRYFRSRRNILHQETQRYNVINANHRALSNFIQILESGCLNQPYLRPKPAVEIVMDDHAKQLRTTDAHIEIWIAERKQASELRACLNERIVAENSRMVAANERREVAARIIEADGRGSWTTANKDKWNADLAKRRELYRKWEYGFSVWQLNYQRMLFDDEVFEGDIAYVMERQAVWSRWVGNWQIDSYFDEVEALNAEDTNAAPGKDSARDTEAAKEKGSADATEAAEEKGSADATEAVQEMHSEV